MGFRSVVPEAGGRDQCVYMFSIVLHAPSPLFFCVLIFVCSVKCRKGLFFLVVRGKDCAVASARRCPGREWRRRCAHARVCRGRTRRTSRPALSWAPGPPRALSRAPGLSRSFALSLIFRIFLFKQENLLGLWRRWHGSLASSLGAWWLGAGLCPGRGGQLSARACPAAADLLPG